MAIYHLHIEYICRSKNPSIVAVVAKRTGTRLFDERLGILHDYTQSKNVVYSQIMAPQNAPSWVYNREKLWNAVEKAETQPRARTGRSIEIALPIELTFRDHINLVSSFIMHSFIKLGMIADFSIRSAFGHNPHCYIILPDRELNSAGTWSQKAKKIYLLNDHGEKIKNEKGRFSSRSKRHNNWGSKDTFMMWREQWAKDCNSYFESFGIDARIDHRSFKDQGINREPQIHEGVMARDMQQKGKTSDRIQKNNEIKERNRIGGFS